MEVLATVTRSDWTPSSPWIVKIKESKAHRTKACVFPGSWKTKKKAQAFADEFNRLSNERWGSK
jgi:hypothetical protein